MLFQFLAALLSASVVVGGTSLLWPKLTTAPRPKQLAAVREVVLRTPIGQQAATVLGVADETNIEPINVSSLAGSLAQQAAGAVTDKVTEQVTSRAVSQIVSQIDKLPQDQRQALEQAICKIEE